MNIYAFDDVVPVIHPTAFVHPSAVIIGDVFIGAYVYVAPCASLRGDMGRILIGQNSNVQDCVVVHGFPDTDTVVEEDGHIGHGAIIHGCILRRNVMIGMNAVIMDNAVIGESAIVGAASFVGAQQQIPPRSLALGTPARVTRNLTEAELAWKVTSTEAYRRLGQRSRRQLRPCIPLAAPEPDRRRVDHDAARLFFEAEAARPK